MNSELLSRLVDEILSRPVDREKLAAEEAARTDPWRWYCRLCGTRGEAAERGDRDRDARAHLADTRCGRHAVVRTEEAGRLMHVWTHP